MEATLLIIAGSDSSCGAGIAADLEAARACGARPLLAVSAVTAQTDESLLASHPVPPLVLEAQLKAAELAQTDLHAVKIGMLPNEAAVETVADFLERLRPPNIVLDPVLASSSGGPLASASSLETAKKRLFPLVDLLTPNLPEATHLTGLPAVSEEDLPLLAQKLHKQGPAAVLLKGGHLDGPCADLLLKANAESRLFRRERLRPVVSRGTGCRLATATAAFLSMGEDLEKAVERACDFVQTYLKR